MFDVIAREWRCKWSDDSDKRSLSQAQEVLSGVVDQLKAIKGFKSLQRVVCGDCKDFKVLNQQMQCLG